MTYTLYYSPGTASMAVHSMLIELGVPFDTVLVDFETGAQRDPDYLRMNPAGRVPTLIIDGQAYSESAALLMILSERHPDAGLAPRPGEPRRAKWLETMVFLANTVLPAMRDWFYADTDGAPQGAQAVRDLARKRIEGAWPRLRDDLSGRGPFLFGEVAGAADFLAATLMRWSRNMPSPANSEPELASYLARMGALSSYGEVCRREELTPWP
jgi:glutathione S-transferase